MSADTLRLVSDDVSREREEAAEAPPSWPDSVYPSSSDDDMTDRFGAHDHPWSPTSVPPYPWEPTEPTSPPPSAPADEYGLAGTPDPLSSAGLGGAPYPRRITPSPPPRRGRLLLGLVIGLLAGVLLAGTAGFLVGRATGTGRPVPAASTATSGYLADLVTANRAKLTGELATLAQPWLAELSGCLADTDPGGPRLPAGERVHVFCRDGGMAVHFATYVSADEKLNNRAFRQQLALGTPAILAGNESQTRRLGPVTGTAGTYIEYALKPADGRALCGVWWDVDNSNSALYAELLCESLGGSWDPLRAVWQRHG
jgi:hypothetical protein